MTESELAFNANGEPFDLPETATGWRVRRLRGGRGAPELVYGRDGRPLTLGIDAGMDELREAVEHSGRYRLDAVDDDGKVVPNVPPSYVQNTVAERNSSMPEAGVGVPVAMTSTDLAVRELVRANVELARQNTELARTVATQQPDLVKAAADILRAADGAGLPRREPTDDWYDDEEEDEAETASRPAFDIAAIMAQLVPVIARLTGMDAGKVGILLGSGDGAARTPTISASVPKQLPTKSRPRTAHAPSEARRSTEPAKVEQTDDADAAQDFVAPDPIAHFMAIQAQLTADERAYVQNVINKLDVADLKQWRDQLARTPVDEAVSMIRTEIEKRKEKVS